MHILAVNVYQWWQSPLCHLKQFNVKNVISSNNISENCLSNSLSKSGFNKDPFEKKLSKICQNLQQSKIGTQLLHMHD